MINNQLKEEKERMIGKRFSFVFIFSLIILLSAGFVLADEMTRTGVVSQSGTYNLSACAEDNAGNSICLSRVFIVNLCIDNDGDGYGSIISNSGCPNIGVDCNDNNPSINPNAADSNCNGIDENCDGLADDEYIPTATSCGLGECFDTGQLICSNGQTQDTCTPGSPSNEVCEGAFLDENCNGVSNEGCNCINGDTQNCGNYTLGVCQKGVQTCTNGQWGECIGVINPSNEICDGLDNNCDGVVDETFTDKGDMCSVGLGVCQAIGTKVCSQDGQSTVCNAVPTQATGDDSSCNGIDENCDGIADNNYIQMSTSCGIGICSALGITSCINGIESDSCTAGVPQTELCDLEIKDEDCDGTGNEGCACVEGQTESCGTSDVGECVLGIKTCDIYGQWGSCIGSVEPTVEVCDGLDNNCNGDIDETFSGLGDSCTVGLGVCQASGNIICSNDKLSTTCSVVPGQPTGTDESCNGIDENCDGLADDNYTSVPTGCGVDFCYSTGTLACISGQIIDTCVPKPPVTVYRDADIDNYGDMFNTLSICTLPLGYILTNEDCNDNDASVNPGAKDICSIDHNPINKDCNAGNDNELDCNDFCGDIDGDGYVTPQKWTDWGGIIPGIICPWVVDAGDCNDYDSAISPTAVEVCDGLDNNCNSITDEGCSSTNKQDALVLLKSLNSADKKSSDELGKAIKELEQSLGNLNPNGDKKIVWIDSVHIACRHGYKAFDDEKKTIEHLEKVSDPAIIISVNSAISSIVAADRLLAQTAINEAPLTKHRLKAIENFNKGEAATDNKHKIQYYRKAWKYVNKNCEKIDKVSCIEELTLISPNGDSVSAIGDEIGLPDTVLTDIFEAQVTVKTDCNKCIKVGDNIKGWIISEIIDDGTLALKCAKK